MKKILAMCVLVVLSFTGFAIADEPTGRVVPVVMPIGTATVMHRGVTLTSTEVICKITAENPCTVAVSGYFFLTGITDADYTTPTAENGMKYDFYLPASSGPITLFESTVFPKYRSPSTMVGATYTAIEPTGSADHFWITSAAAEDTPFFRLTIRDTKDK